MTKATSRADTLLGSSGADSINGLGGNDSLSGGDGDDTLTGGHSSRIDFSGAGSARVPFDRSLDIGGSGSTGAAIEMWVRLDNVSGSRFLGGRHALFQLEVFNGVLRYAVNGPQGWGWRNTGVRLSVGETAHIAVSYDKATGRIEALKNGVVISTATGRAGTDITPVSGYAHASVHIGGYSSHGGVDGAVWDVRLWNEYRDASAITASMKGEVEDTAPNLAGYWKIDEGGGPTLTDSSGNGHDATITGRVAWMPATASDDTLDGGAGNDVAVFTGNRADYDLTRTADGVRVTDREDRDGSDLLRNIETLRFADGDVSISGPNVAPTAVADTGFAAIIGQPVSIPVASLLANDSDANGLDVLTISNVGNAANGTAVLEADGSVTFTPAAGFIGTATFEYTVSDGNGGTDTGTVSVDVALADATPGADTLSGSSGADSINGLGGNDSLSGGDGDDTLTGGHSSRIDFSGAGSARVPFDRSLDIGGSGSTGAAIEMWVRLDNVSGSRFLGGRHALFQLEVFNGVLRYAVNGPQGWGWRNTGVRLSVGETAHIAVSYDKATGRIEALKNGVVISTATGRAGTDITPVSGYAHASVHIGGYSSHGGVDGAVWDVRLWNEYRDASAITASMKGEVEDTAPNLAGYWKIDEGGGPTLTDSSGNGHDATITGRVAWMPATASDDTLDGGAGNDVAVFTGNRADYDLTRTADGVRVTDREDRDGSDLLRNIETLRFADGDVSISGPNVAPTAVADTGFAAIIGQPVSIPVASLLANDSDANGLDVLTISNVGNAANGTAVLEADGSVTFTPAAGFIGTATFEYTVSDGNGGTDTGTVSVDVALADATPGADTLSGSSGADSINGLGGNDSLSGGDGDDTLTGGHSSRIDFSGAGSARVPFDRSLDIGGSGSTGAAIEMWVRLDNVSGSRFLGGRHALFQLEVFNGVLRYAVNGPQGWGWRNTGVRLSVGETAHIAVSYDKATGRIEALKNGVVISTATGRAGTDITPVSGYAHASVHIGGYSSHGGVDGAVWDVRLWNEYRDASAITASMKGEVEDTAPNLAGYWKIDEGGGPTLTDSSGNGHDATITGRVAWMPATASDDTLDGGAGNDVAVFTGKRADYDLARTADGVRVTDREGRDGSDLLRNIETLRFADGDVSISGPNVAPTAVADTGFAAIIGQPVSIPVASLLANDSDANGLDVLTISNVGNAANGTAVLEADGSVTFTPAAGFIGTATFEYTVSDGNGGTDTATVSVDVALADATPGADTLLGSSGADSINGLGGNDSLSGGDGDDTLTGGRGRRIDFNGASSAKVPFDRSLDIGGSGSTGAAIEMWVRLDNVSGPQFLGGRHGLLQLEVLGGVLRYAVNGPQGWGWHNTGVRLSVGETAHIAVSYDKATGRIEALKNGVVISTVTGRAGTDITPLSGYAQASVYIGAAGGYGRVDGGIWDVRLWNEYRDASAITASMKGEVGDTAPNLAGYWKINDGGPTLADSSGNGHDATITGRVAWMPATASDDTLDGGAGNDVAVFTGKRADYDLTPTADGLWVTDREGRDGSDLLRNIETLRFADGDVSISGPNVAPTAVADTGFAAIIGQPVSIPVASLLANDSDANGLDVLTISNVGNAANGTAVLEADGSVTFTPAAGFIGTATFEYTVSDGNGGTDTATVSVDVALADATPGADTLLGSSGADSINGLGGNDSLSGGDGDDTLTGGRGRRIDFNGASSAKVPFDRSLDIGGSGSTGAAIEMWVRLDNVSGPQFLGGRHGLLQLEVLGGVLRYAVNGPQGWGWHNTGVRLSVGETAHIAVSYDKATGRIEALKNGVVISTVTGRAGTDITPLSGYAQASVYIGAAGGYGRVDGGIWDVRLWNEYRDASAITASMKGEVGDTAPNLAGYWKINDGGPTLADSSGNGHDATITGRVAWMPATASDDTLDGGAGNDVAVFTGKRADYDLTPTADGLWVTDREGHDGSDLLRNIETLRFADGDVSISGPNVAPTAVADTGFAAIIGQPVSIPVASLLANDSDANGLDVLTISNVGNAANGTAVLEADGSVTFTPAAGFIGTATFEYTVSDGNGGTDTATVSVDVALADATPGADTLLGSSGADSINGLGGNDSLSGGDGDDTLTGGRGRRIDFNGASSAKVPFDRSLDIGGSGSTGAAIEMWVRLDNVSGPQFLGGRHGLLQLEVLGGVLRYAVNGPQGWGWHNTGVRLSVGETAHIAVSYDKATGRIEALKNGVVISTVTGRAGTDITPLSGYAQASVYIGAAGGYGRVDGGIWDVRLWNEYRDASAITASMKGEVGDTAPNLAGYWKINDGGPTLADSSGNGHDATITGRVAWMPATASDDTLDGGAGNDVAVFTGKRADYDLTPTADGLWVTDREGHDGSDLLRNIETLRFADDEATTGGPNVAPTAADDTGVSTTVGQPVSIPTAVLLANDSDANILDVLTIGGVGNAANGTVVLEADGSVTFTPAAGFTGTATFDYTVSDGNGGTDTATVSVDVALARASQRADSLFGSGGADSLDGASGNDSLFGGGGDDTLTGGQAVQLDFNGAGYARVAAGPSLNVGGPGSDGAALELWVQLDSVSGSQYLGGRNGLCALRVRNGMLQYTLNGPQGGGWHSTGVRLGIGETAHVAVSYNKASGRIHVLKNGNVVSMVTGTPGADLIPAGGGSTGGGVYIGGTGSGNGVKGAVWGMRLWNGYRDPSAITASMNGRVGDTAPNLAGYWKVQEGGGTTLADSSGNGHGATVVGGGVWTTTASNDTLDGGAGHDYVVLRGNRADYDLVRTPEGVRVIDRVGNDGSDLLRNIETLRFADGDVAVGTPLAPQVATKESAFTFTVPVGAFTGVDPASMRLTATLADGSALPGWLRFDAATGTFTGTPDDGDLTDLSVRVTATDATGAVASDLLALTVAAVNDAPVVSATTLAATEDSAVSLPASLFAGAYSDAEGTALASVRIDRLPVSGALTLSGVAVTAGQVIAVADLGGLRFTPAADFAGEVTIGWSGSDGTAWSSAGAALTVSVVAVNDAPEVAVPLAPQVATAGVAFRYALPAGTFIDVDDTGLTLTADLADGNALPGWLRFDAVTGTFTGTPDDGDLTGLSVRVTATDAAGALVSTVFALTGTAGNGPAVPGAAGTMTASQRADSLSGSAGADSLDGMGGNDSLFGGGGDDTLDGGQGNQLDFNAVGYARVAAGASLNLGGSGSDGVALELRVRLDTVSGSRFLAGLDGLCALRVHNGKVQYALNGPQDSGWHDTGATVTAGETAHVALSYDKASGAIYTLKNGVVVGLVTGRAGVALMPVSGGGMSIGGSGTAIDGAVWDVRLWNGYRDPAAIIASIRGWVGDRATNLVGYWKVDEGGGTTLADSSGNGHGATVVGGVWTTTASDDTLDGGAGHDCAVLHGNRADYDLVRTADGLRVTDRVGHDGSDLLRNIESLRFADGDVTVGTPLVPQVATEESAFTFTVPVGAFTGVDPASMRLTATLADGSALPGWLRFDAATGTFTGTPDDGDLTDLSVRVTATDATGAMASDLLTLTVAAVNDAPVVSATTLAVTEDSTVSLPASLFAGAYSDAEGTALASVRIDRLPVSGAVTLSGVAVTAGQVIAVADLGGLRFTPAADFAGEVTIGWSGSDGTAWSSAGAALTVSVAAVNDAPEVAVPLAPQVATAGVAFRYALPAGTFTDVDDTGLTLTADLADGNALPGWLRFDAATGTFTGTPDDGDLTGLSVRVTAADAAGAVVSTVFALTGTAGNGPAVPGAAGTTTVSHQADSLSGSGSADSIDGSGGNDSLFGGGGDDTLDGGQGNQLDFNAVGYARVAAGASLNLGGSGSDGVALELRVRLDTVSGSQFLAGLDGLFALRVHNGKVQYALNGPQDSGWHDTGATVTAGETAHVALSYDKASGAIYTLKNGVVVGLVTGRAGVALMPVSGGGMSIGGSGSGTAIDGAVWDVRLWNGYRDPAAIIASIRGWVGDRATNLVGYWKVDEGDGTALADSSGNGHGATVVGGAVWTTTASDDTLDGGAGHDCVMLRGKRADYDLVRTPEGVRVIDRVGNDGSDLIRNIESLRFADGNVAVGVPLVPQVATEESAFTFTVPVGAFTGVDPASMRLTATLADGSALPGWLRFDAATGTFTGTPDDGDLTDLSVRVTATDATGAVASDLLALTVAAVNDAPVVSATTLAATEDSAVSLPASLFAGAYSDAEGTALASVRIDRLPVSGALTLSGVAVTAGQVIAVADLGGLRFTPAADFAGEVTIGWSGSDGTAWSSAGAALTVSVAAANDAPEVAVPLAPQVATAGVAFRYALPAGTFIDVDHTGLTLTADLADGNALPGWLRFDAATGTFTGTPDDGDLTGLSVRVTATDAAGAVVSTVFALTGTAGNSPAVPGAAGTTTVSHQADSLSGSGSADSLDGMGGNDSLFGGGGDDTLDGGQGNQLDFNAVGYARVAAGASLNLGGSGSDGVALELRVRLDTVSGSQFLAGLDGLFALRVHNGKVQYALNGPQDSGWHDTGATVTAGETAHVALSYDKASGAIYTLKNGVVVGLVTGRAGVALMPVSGGGMSIGGSGSGTAIDGAVWDVRLWNGYRDPAAIIASIRGWVGDRATNLVGYWKVDEGDGTALADSSGNGHGATVVGGAVWTTTASDDTLDGGDGHDYVVFRGKRADYDLIWAADGLRVTDRVGHDGSDLIRNIESLRFADGDVAVDSLNRPPTASDDTGVETTIGQPISIPAASLLANDSDPNAKDVLTIGGVGSAVNGTVVLETDGSVTFTPAVGFIGAATFEYTVSDGNGGTDTATVSVDVVRAFATPRADTVSGSNGADSIDGLGGNDSLFGAGGNDMLTDRRIDRIDFSGTSYARVPADPSLDIGRAGADGAAIELWVQLDTISRTRYLAGQRDLFQLWVIDGVLEYELTGLKGSVWRSTGVKLTAGETAHIAVSYDKTTGRINALKNGVVISTATLKAGADIIPFNNPFCHDAVFIGGTYPPNRVDGAIWDVRLWNEYRDTTEIKASMNGQVGDTAPNLAGYWRVDEGSGTTLADSSGNGHTATIQGRATWTTAPSDDTLHGGAGTDTLAGGAGDDTYLFNRGDGADTVEDDGGTDTAEFGPGIAHDQLWFARRGEDLTVSVIGTTDVLTVTGWFGTANPAPIETLEVAGGHDVTAAQINNLVTAMAAYTPPGSGATDISGYATSLRTDVDSMWGVS